MIYALVKGMGLGLLLSISAGPIVFAIIKLSMKFGHKAGYAFISGVSVSDLLLVVLGNAAAELVRSAMKFETYIAVAGAALLIIMGTWSLFFKKDPVMDNNDLAFEFRKRDIARFSLQGFFMNILNPGPIFFWLTTVSAFAYLPLKERLVLFAACLAMILGTDILKVLLAGKIRTLLTPKTLHNINRFSALVLIGFGVAIAIGVWLTKNE
jgi:threonine/homoserine/homoserine lactone efflux protein